MFKDKYKTAQDAVRMTDADKATVMSSMQRKRKSMWFVPVAAAVCICLIAGGILTALLKAPGKITPDAKTVVAKAENAQSYAEVYAKISELQSNREYFALDGMDYNGMVKGAAISNEAAPTQIAAESADDYSKTNVQIDGVDESDVIKTDGRYIYILSHDTSKGIRIYKADGKDTKLVSTVSYAKDATELTVTDPDPDKKSIYYIANGMYLSDNTLVVIAWRGMHAHTRMYCCDWYFPGAHDGETHIFFFDVNDPQNPELISEIEQDGYYLESRLTGGVLYTVTTYGLGLMDAVSEDEPESYIPKYKDKNGQHVISAGDITILDNAEDPHYCVATSVEMKSCTDVRSSVAILGQANGLFASHDNLLLYNNAFEYEEHPAVADENGGIKYVSESDDVETYAWKDIKRSELFLISMKDGKLNFEKSTTLDGWIDDQFSVDEYKDHLRILVNVDNSETLLRDHYDENGNVDGQVADAGRPIVSETYNTLYILDMDLGITGKLDDIAKGEYVKSARFMGDTGYFVTFRQTDPLFSVDLSDPKKPAVIGKLKIPGFSEYLQSYGDGLLFGLGLEADTENGGTTGTKISMFDISDPANVHEIARKVLKNKWSSATHNHKAILADPVKNLIGFNCDGNYLIYSFDGQKFVKKAEIKLNGEWSYDLRGLYIGDMFYVVDYELSSITVLDLQSFEQAAMIKAK